MSPNSETVNVVQALVSVIGTVSALIIPGTVAVGRIVTRLVLMEAEVRRLADLVEKQNGRLRRLEDLEARHHPES